MSSRDLRGGDQWYNARAQSLCFRAAVVVHRLGSAGSRDVAAACGISLIQANEVLRACLRRPYLFHIRRIGRGRYATITTAIRGRSSDASVANSTYRSAGSVPYGGFRG